MVDRSEQKGKIKLVLIGVGFSGLELIRHWLLNPGLGSVTVIAESPVDIFVFEALCSLKGVSHDFFLEDPGETNRWQFLVAKVERVEVDEKRIFYREGSITFDILVLVNECLPTILRQGIEESCAYPHSGNAIEKMTLKNVKQVVVRGNGFIALALADYLLGKGLEPTVFTAKNALKRSNFPQEEASLLARQLRNRGVKLNFDQEINRFEFGLNGELQAVQLNDGIKLACQLAIDEQGTMGAFLMRCDQWRAPDNEFFVYGEVANWQYKGVYLLGKNRYAGGTNALDLSPMSLGDQGVQLARNITGTTVCPEGACRYPQYFHLAGLDWVTHGDLSTFCGKNSQNFYWEHPNGKYSFRLVFDKFHFTVLALGTLGMQLDSDFVERAIHGKKHVSDFMEGLDAGVLMGKTDPNLLFLISKAFSVEFRQIKRHKDSSLMQKLLYRFF